jgi:hypothetical protein
MRKYAEDVDIAPIELMIVVRIVICRFDGQLMADLACYDRHRTRTTPQGYPLVQISAAYLTFITLGSWLPLCARPTVAHLRQSCRCITTGSWV